MFLEANRALNNLPESTVINAHSKRKACPNVSCDKWVTPLERCNTGGLVNKDRKVGGSRGGNDDYSQIVTGFLVRKESSNEIPVRAVDREKFPWAVLEFSGIEKLRNIRHLVDENPRTEWRGSTLITTSVHSCGLLGLGSRIDP